MRTMRTISMGLLLGAGLFTACNKSDHNMVDPASNNNGAFQREAAGTLHFKEAYVHAAEIVFMNNDETVYKTRPDVAINLAAVLDKELPNRHYDNYLLRISALPRGESGALLLKGAFQDSDGRDVAVTFRYSEPVLISNAGRIVKTGPVSFLTLLKFDFGLLGREIQPDLLMNAERTDNGILISRDMNAHLYERILEQLRNMVRMQDYNLPGPVVAVNEAEHDGGFLQ